jgi:hypothetical protein
MHLLVCIKDLVKVLTYSGYNSNKNRLKKLVFISESKGIESLRNRLDEKKFNNAKKYT